VSKVLFTVSYTNLTRSFYRAGKTPINTHFNHTHTPLDIAKHVEDVHSDSVNQILQFSEAELASLMEKM